MDLPTFLVLLVVVAIFGAICWCGWRNHKKGKHSCGGNCGSCNGCGH